MNHRLSSAVAVSGLVWLLGCGEDSKSKEPGPLQEEAGFVLEGQVVSLDAASQAGATRLTIAWENWMRSGDIIVSQGSVAVPQSLPSAYSLRLTGEPGPGALNDLGAGAGFLGTGRIAVYQDVNGDDRFDLETEPLRGLSATHVVLYAPTVTPALLSELREWNGITNLEALVPGYQLARGVCRDGTSFDALEIVPAVPVSVVSESESDDGCLNYH
ncbi:hypothetical protein MYSTI_02608 [Myxococcus stipitatus DSM 14675]|uniref:Lipoprotein n=1 Tax=Myxococcus stipitatus (strain DSM 14675 / JCM 12634 / Mx s8) TaxID=1278073 RepID=L7UBW3_MYXSD|nr:hypothetical protein [Myxococcus stipitatus]AGC43924.1 hypothetical protein MYSTI_02608 [Myxococcus stipitatus DSM 14675]